MTEDEAKTKWCPFARNIGTLTQPVHGVETVIAFGTQNRGYQMGGALNNCRCIGSACMAWQWHQEPHDEVPAHTEHVGGSALLRSARPAFPGNGFCGLAGRPS